MSAQVRSRLHPSAWGDETCLVTFLWDWELQIMCNLEEFGFLVIHPDLDFVLECTWHNTHPDCKPNFALLYLNPISVCALPGLKEKDNWNKYLPPGYTIHWSNSVTLHLLSQIGIFNCICDRSKQNVLRKIAQNGNDNFWILHWQESSLPLSPHPRYPVHRRKWHSKYQCLRGRPGDGRQGQGDPGSNSELVVTESGTWVRPKSYIPSPPIFPPELLVHTYPTGQVQMWSFRRENSCEDGRAGEEKITERPVVLGW